LRGRAIFGDGLDEAERGGERDRHRGVAMRDFLYDERVEHARLFRRFAARDGLNEAERPRPLEQGFGEHAVLVGRPRGGTRDVPREAFRGRARDVLVFRQREGDHAAFPIAVVNAIV
jgi:hypothetical protein